MGEIHHAQSFLERILENNFFSKFNGSCLFKVLAALIIKFIHSKSYLGRSAFQSKGDL